MKIIETVGGKKVIYLQGYEIPYIMEIAPDSLPSEILNQSGTTVTVDADSAYRFDCAISRPENVAWLEGRRDIVDYDEYAYLEPAKLEETIFNISRSARDAYANYKEHGKDYRDAHRAEMKAHLTEKAHKVESLKFLLRFLRGEIEFVFPNEVFESEKPEKLGFFRRIWADFIS